ncbi:MAG: ECF-type sigma factor [Mariniblastus sp.]
MSGTITAWLDRMRLGDPNAVERLWNYFSPDLIRNLAPECSKLKICDEEDIVIVAFYQLTKAMEENKAEGITNRREFWKLLRVITKNKVRDWLRYDTAKRRGGDERVLSISSCDVDDASKLQKSTIESYDDCDLIERFQKVVGKMDRPEYSEVIRLKVSGKTNAEIARELGLALRTIQYLISSIKQVWLESFRDDDRLESAA